MKKLWKRALGMIKDRNSLGLAKLLRKSRHRNPNLESFIIKSTSHDDTFIDYNNSQRVFVWIQSSPSHLTIFLRALTRRVERTQDWAVALKCMILFHGVLCTKAPGTRRIGRLPFDLTSFEDAFTRRDPTRLDSRSAFVRAYFTFTDAKSVVMAVEEGDMVEEKEEEMKVRLIWVSRWQKLMDEIMEVKPQGYDILNELLVMEAMDCMIIEVFELYSKICDGIAKALMLIHTHRGVDIDEATLALDVLQKASKQGEQLSNYFEFCRKIGVLRSSECPRIEKIHREDFVELERIINGGSTCSPIEHEEEVNEVWMQWRTQEFPAPLSTTMTLASSSSGLTTVITDVWEVFDDNDIIKLDNENEKIILDPFASSHSYPLPLVQYNPFVDYGGNSHLVVSL